MVSVHEVCGPYLSVISRRTIEAIVVGMLIHYTSPIGCTSKQLQGTIANWKSLAVDCPICNFHAVATEVQRPNEVHISTVTVRHCPSPLVKWIAPLPKFGSLTYVLWSGVFPRVRTSNSTCMPWQNWGHALLETLQFLGSSESSVLNLSTHIFPKPDSKAVFNPSANKPYKKLLEAKC